MYTMPTVSSISTPDSGTLAEARAQYTSLAKAAKRGDSDQTILANHNITAETLAVLRTDPMFIAAQIDV